MVFVVAEPIATEAWIVIVVYQGWSVELPDRAVHNGLAEDTGLRELDQYAALAEVAEKNDSQIFWSDCCTHSFQAASFLKI